MIVRSHSELMRRYHALKAGDIVNCRVISKKYRHVFLLDLMQKGVRCFPSALSQTLNGSKVAQGLLLMQWMMPHTKIIQRRADLMRAIHQYNKGGIGRVVTKEDKMHCGYGVRLWDHIEMLYSSVGLSGNFDSFLLQPFLENLIDVRVIIAGDYVEAYSRLNPDSFRNNLSVGGSCRSYNLDADAERFCREIMRQGRFPYAHVDLHLTEAGDHFLSEIALNGGIKGAKITRNELNRKKEAVIEQLVQEEVN